MRTIEFETLPGSEHFCVMAFAQLTYRESLRDIETCLAGRATKLYHMGIRQAVARATLADANERRDWRLYPEFSRRLIVRPRALYASDSFGVALDHTVYALDAYGTSENAVKTQIWIAVAVYVLAAIIKKELDVKASLHALLPTLPGPILHCVAVELRIALQIEGIPSGPVR